MSMVNTAQTFYFRVNCSSETVTLHRDANCSSSSLLGIISSHHGSCGVAAWDPLLSVRLRCQQRRVVTAVMYGEYLRELHPRALDQVTIFGKAGLSGRSGWGGPGNNSAPSDPHRASQGVQPVLYGYYLQYNLSHHGVERETMQLDDGAPWSVDFLPGCRVYECYSLSNATLRQYAHKGCTGRFDSIVVAMPHTFTGPLVHDAVPPQLSFSCESADSRVTWRLSELGKAQCTLDYASCGDAPNQLPWAAASGCHILPMFIDACDTCKVAGVATFFAACVAMTAQLPLMYLAMKRATSSTDSRAIKLLVVLLSCAVITLMAVAQYLWYDGCFLAVHNSMQMIIDRGGWGSFAFGDSAVRWWAFIPTFAAVTAFVGLLYNLATPVPEVYTDEVFCERRYETKENSLPQLYEKIEITKSRLPAEVKGGAVPLHRKILDETSDAACGVDGQVFV